MIDTPDKYKLTEVVPGNITGKILPAVDGTPEAWVLRHENLSYLTEMCREVACLAEPAGLRTFVPTYDKNRMVICRQVLAEVADVAKNEFGLENGWSVADSGVIPKEWMIPSTVRFPIVTSGAADPMAELKRTMALERHVDRVSFIPAGDEVRAMYYDLAAMRRFYGLAEGSTGSGMTWEQLAAAWEPIKRQSLMFGPCVVGDGDMTLRETSRTGTRTTTQRGYTRPFMDETYGASGVMTYGTSLTGDLALVTSVRLDDYELGVEAIAWVELVAEAEMQTAEGKVRERRAMVFPSALSYVGETGGTPMSAMGKKVYRITVGSEMAMLFQLAKRWMEVYVPGMAECTYFSVQLEHVYYDTGAMVMRSEIDSTGWDWEPQGE